MVTTPLRPAGRTRGPARTGTTPPPAASRGSRWWQRCWTFLEGRGSASAPFYLILGCATALTVIGLVMVLSSSSVENIGETSGSYDLFIRQAVFGILGLGVMLVLSRLGTTRLRALAWPAIILAVILLALVLTPLGHEVNGNRNWLKIGGFTAQPSEAAKLALALWAGVVLERKAALIGQLKHVIVPVLFPVGAVLLGLIMLGRDLGTAMVIMMILAAVLFLAGTKLRYFLVAGAVGAVAAGIFALTSANRAVRIQAWLGECGFSTDPCYQPQHGMFALASGGWWGVGLGQSRQKWSYIPEAENDFIFTILGEELGLVGTLLVIGLFAGLAIGMFRVARRSDSLFVKITTGGILAWIIGQAFVNIAMVTGLLPVIGVPLPFISYGGSALTLVLSGVGIVLGFARAQGRASARPQGRAPARPQGRAPVPTDRPAPRTRTRTTTRPAPGGTA